MKKYLYAVTVLILIMALIPAAINRDTLFSLLKSTSTESLTGNAVMLSNEYKLSDKLVCKDKTTNTESSRSTRSLLYSIVGAAADNDFLEAEVKALAVAVHTQLCHDCDNGTITIDTADKNIFLNENELKDKFGKNTTTFRSYCDNVYSIIILADGNPADLHLSFDSSEISSDSSKANPYLKLSDNNSKAEASAAHHMAMQGNTCEEILYYIHS